MAHAAAAQQPNLYQRAQYGQMVQQHLAQRQHAPPRGPRHHHGGPPRHSGHDASAVAAKAAFPECRDLKSVGMGVRIKGLDKAQQLDGVQDSGSEGVYFTHSDSGQAEFRLVDAASMTCSCPNSGLMCSHRFAVCAKHPRHRIPFALAIKLEEELRKQRMVVAQGGRPETADGVASRLALAAVSWMQTQPIGCLSDQRLRARAADMLVEPVKLVCDTLLAIKLQSEIDMDPRIQQAGHNTNGDERWSLWWMKAARDASQSTATFQKLTAKAAEHEANEDAPTALAAQIVAHPSRAEVVALAFERAIQDAENQVRKERERLASQGTPEAALAPEFVVRTLQDAMDVLDECVIEGTTDTSFLATTLSESVELGQAPAAALAAAFARSEKFVTQWAKLHAAAAGLLSSDGPAQQPERDAPANSGDAEAETRGDAAVARMDTDGGEQRPSADTLPREALLSVRVAFKDLTEFVEQASLVLAASRPAAKRSDGLRGLREALSCAVCANYHVDDFGELGWGSLDSFLSVWVFELREGESTRAAEVDRAFNSWCSTLRPLAQRDVVWAEALAADLDAVRPDIGDSVQHAMGVLRSRCAAGGLPGESTLVVGDAQPGAYGLRVPSDATGLNEVLASCVKCLDAPGAARTALSAAMSNGGAAALQVGLIDLYTDPAAVEACAEHNVAWAQVASYASRAAACLPGRLASCQRVMRAILPPKWLDIIADGPGDAQDGLDGISIEDLVVLKFLARVLSVERRWETALQHARGALAKAADGREAPRPPRPAVLDAPAATQDARGTVAQGASAAPDEARPRVVPERVRRRAEPEHPGPQQQALGGSELCMQAIESIRRERFGIGIDVPESVQGPLRNTQQGLHRAVERLAKDIYSGEARLLMELLQNADDAAGRAHPAERNAFPAVALVLCDQGLAVASNEPGFTADDVSSLCNIGMSSKQRGAAEIETGEKGIGFKSVFALSDTPTIVSNGFSFRFNAQDATGLGYLLPEWESRTREELLPFDAGRLPSGTTTLFWLPARDKLLQSGRWSKLADDLRSEASSPSTLLFLHTLRRITVLDVRSGAQAAETELLRRDETPGDICSAGVAFTSITEQPSGVRRHWLRCAADIPNDLRVPRGESATPATTKIEVALPITALGQVKRELDAADVQSDGNDGNELDSHALAPWARPSDAQLEQLAQIAYCTLPVRNYGLPFAVQAHFVLTTSREDISRDVVWNQWTRENIPAVLRNALLALLACRDHPDHPHEGVREAAAASIAWPLLLPRSGAGTGFFATLASEAPKLMRQTKCLAAKDSGILETPNSLLLCPTAALDAISEDSVRAATGCACLDPDVARYIPDCAARQLGLQRISVPEAAKAALETLNKPGPLQSETLPWRVLCALHDTWAAQSSPQTLKRALLGLRDLPLLPLSGCGTHGRCRTVWLPPAAAAALAGSRSTGAGLAEEGPAFGFEHELALVSSGGLLDLSDTARSRVRDVLQALDVRTPSVQEVVRDFVLPRLERVEPADTPGALGGEHRVIVGCLAYALRHQRALDDGLLQQLASSARFVLHDGRIVGPGTGVHVMPPVADGSPLGSDTWEGRFLHEAYLEHESLESWSAFVCGVLKRGLPCMWPADVATAALALVRRTDDRDRAARLAGLLDHVDRHWVDWEAAAATGSAEADRARDKLRTLAWVPVTRGGVSAEDYSGIESLRLVQPSRALVASRRQGQQLGAAAHYSCASITSPGLAEWLGLATEPTSQHVIAQLQAWSDAVARGAAMTAEQEAAIVDGAAKAFRILHAQDSERTAAAKVAPEAFASSPLVIARAGSGPGLRCAKSTRAVVHDPTAVLTREGVSGPPAYDVVLADTYPEDVLGYMSDASWLGVPRSPPAEVVLRALTYCSLSGASRADVERAVLALLSYLGSLLSRSKPAGAQFGPQDAGILEHLQDLKLFSILGEDCLRAPIPPAAQAFYTPRMAGRDMTSLGAVDEGGAERVLATMADSLAESGARQGRRPVVLDAIAEPACGWTDEAVQGMRSLLGALSVRPLEDHLTAVPVAEAATTEGRVPRLQDTSSLLQRHAVVSVHLTALARAALVAAGAASVDDANALRVMLAQDLGVVYALDAGDGRGPLVTRPIVTRCFATQGCRVAFARCENVAQERRKALEAAHAALSWTAARSKLPGVAQMSPPQRRLFSQAIVASVGAPASSATAVYDALDALDSNMPFRSAAAFARCEDPADGALVHVRDLVEALTSARDDFGDAGHEIGGEDTMAVDGGEDGEAVVDDAHGEGDYGEGYLGDLTSVEDAYGFEEEGTDHRAFHPHRPVDNFGESAPPSREFEVEEISTERTRGALQRMPTVTTPQASSAANQDVGRWCEEFVFRVLSEPGALGPGQEVVWENRPENAENFIPELGDTGYPFDIVIRDRRTKAVEVYVEVKGSARAEKEYVEVSNKEWLFAQRQGQRYHIYRVLGALTADARLEVVKNPYLQWRQHQVGMLLTF
ncbi:unnamed protein product [Pedinophyceae sp. YPF-701]|nr:unnamed protein product [Pedinophyceae sp. YPF-701]